VLEGLPPIRVDKPTGIDKHLIDLDPLGALNHALGPDDHGEEMPPRRCGADEIQRRCRQFFEVL
jgi:hypothetical protein